MAIYKETLKEVFKKAHAEAKRFFGSFFGLGRSYKQLFKEALQSEFRTLRIKKETDKMTFDKMESFNKNLKYTF